jgi:hypothetical protein
LELAGDQQLGIELDVRVGQQLPRQLRSFGVRAENPGSLLDHLPPAEIDIAAVGPEEPHDVDDRSLRVPERFGECADVGKRSRRSRNLERLPIEYVPLHVDRDQGAAVEFQLGVA